MALGASASLSTGCPYLRPVHLSRRLRQRLPRSKEAHAAERGIYPVKSSRLILDFGRLVRRILLGSHGPNAK